MSTGAVGEAGNECPDPSAIEACGQFALRSGELEALEDQRGADDDPDDGPIRRRPGRWAAHEAGLDVHAGVRIPAGDHEGRERIVRYAGVLAGKFPWREFVVSRPPEPTAGCRHPRHEARPVVASAPASRAAPDAADPLPARAPQPVPRTLSPERWSRLGEGALLAVQPRVDGATLIRRTFLADALTCPRCRGRMELIDVVTDPLRAREVLLALGLPYQPVEPAPPRDPDDACSRGPPSPPDSVEGVDRPPADDGCPIVPGGVEL